MTRLTISNLQNKAKAIVFEYEGTDVEIFYNPAKFTRAYREKLSDEITALQDESGTISDAKAFTEYRIKFLVDVLVKWNIDNEDGTMFAINQENLEAIPEVLLNALWTAIFEEVNSPLTKKSVVLSA